MTQNTPGPRRPINFTLKRGNDLAEWPHQARSPEEALTALSRAIGHPLFICEGPSAFWLECRDPERSGEAALIVNVSAGKSKAGAIITKVEHGYTVTVLDADQIRLTDESVPDEAGAQAVLEKAMRTYEIAPHELLIRRVNFGRFEV